MNTEYLNIILLEDMSFEELVLKFEKDFKISFVSKNEKGRFVGKSKNSYGDLKIIDRHDDLGEFLSDENHTLEIKVNVCSDFEIEEFERLIKEDFKKSNIKWKYGVWTKLTEFFKADRFIYPLSEV